MYQAPSVQTPSVEELKKISNSLNLGIGESEIGAYHGEVASILKTAYPVLEKYTEPTLPVKYPRTPGRRPTGDENRYNAWYYKSEIQGAPDGPLRGYRVVVKDSFPVAGVPMMNGSRVVEGYVPDYDCTIVTRVLDAGATVVGKATCEDMFSSGHSCTSHPLPVLNPHDTVHSSGGSSSGCAVLVQTGEADLALGGDQGGSIRIPSSWTGIVGLKPTYGLVPYTGIGSMTPAVDHCGPMGRTVKECALLLQVLAGDDAGLDMRQRNIPEPSQIPKYSELLSGDVAGKKIGLLVEGFDECDSEVAATVRGTAESLRQKGATVEDVSIPIHKDAQAIYTPLCLEGNYHTMLRSQGFSVGPPSYFPTSAVANGKAFSDARARDQCPTIKMVQLLGKYVDDNYGLQFYAKSSNLARLVRNRYDEKLATFDVLVMPTLKKTAPKIPAADISVADLLKVTPNMIANTCPFDLTGHPALSLNAGHVDGLPVGMMIVGRHMAEQTVLDVAYAYEQMLKTD